MKKNVLSYLLLSGISQVGDVVFLFFAVMAALSIPHGGLISGILFSLDAVVKILVTPFTARFCDRIPYVDRWKRSALLNLALIVVAIFPGLFPPSSQTGYLVLCLLLTFMYILNNISSQLRMELPYRLEAGQIFALSKFVSFSNLSFRGVYFVAPAIALMLPKNAWLFVSIVNAASFGCMLAASVIGHFQFRGLSLGKTNSSDESLQSGIKVLVRWNCFFLFFVNLAIGGVALLLTYLLKYGGHGLYQIVSPVSILYCGTVLALIFVLISPKNSLMENATTKFVLGSTAGAFFMLVVSSLLDPITILATLFGAGFFYGVSLVAMSPAITRHFSRSDVMATYSSSSQAFGRIGSILSSLGIGVLIDFQINPFLLLFLIGSVGIGFVIFLAYLKRQWSIIW